MHLQGATMGTTYSVKIVPGPQSPYVGDDGPERVLERIERRLERVNALMSTYRPDSEISRFNAAPAGRDFSVSTETLRVMLLARDISRMSDGAFDVTVGPLVNAYGFGAGSHGREPPDAQAIDRARDKVGWRLVEIDPARRTLRKRRDGVYCDLAAIAKGYGVDRIAELLEAMGFRDYMVEIGGEVRARGRNARGVAWRIGIERPSDRDRALQRVIHLTDVGVATSGDYRNFYMADGRRISHTIDPRTGRPIGHHLASVTVVDPSCARADALATALMVLGPEEGAALAARHGIRALFLVRRAESRFNEIESPAFTQWDKQARIATPGGGKELP